MSRLVQERLERAGLLAWLELRARKGALEPEFRDRLESIDLLTIGAAADLARRRECGEEARIYVPLTPPPNESLLVVGSGEPARGSHLLRRIAVLRLTAPIGLRIVVDFGVVGLEIAQVALSFGASDLAGPIASRRGLPLAEVDEARKLFKRAEIAGYVERAGFRPVFIATDAKAGSGDGAPTAAPAAARIHAES
jgi:hypothetical protein